MMVVRVVGRWKEKKKERLCFDIVVKKHIERQKTQNSQINMEEQSHTLLQDLLQSNANLDSVILVKQKGKQINGTH